MLPSPRDALASATDAAIAAAPDTRARDALDAWWRTIFQLAPVGIGLVDMSGRTILSNDALERMLGYEPDEFASAHFRSFTHPDDIDKNVELFQAMARGEIERFELDKRFIHREGHLVFAHLTATLLRDEAGEPYLAIGMLENVTQQREIAARLAQTEETYRTLVEQVPAVVYEAPLELDEPWTYVSPQIERLLGFSPEEWLANPGLWAELLSPEDRPEVVDEERRRAERPDAAVEVRVLHYRMRRADGREVWVRDESRVEWGRQDRPVLRGVLVDATREKQLELRLERLAYHDPLTLLVNRELFRDRVESCMRARPASQRTGAVLFVDLDDFKTINDSLGHAAGDDLICSVAGRLQGCIRPGDTAGRLGGDEFGVLLEDLNSPQDAIDIAERLRAVLERPHRLRGRTVVAPASIGVAYLADADATEVVLRNADLAMYRAKNLGKSRVATYEPALHRLALRRLELRGALGQALARGELRLVFQPVVDLPTGRVVGAEALLRWQHPEVGAIPPDDFIPLAEETGAINPIGVWVLQQACSWLAEHRQVAGGELSVAVNVSPLQLEHHLLAEVEAALVGTGIAPDRLVIEVTEQALMGPRSWEVVGELKRLGVRIAIDDFGTGYSSLAYLSETAVDQLKVDRSFIAALTEDRRTHAVPRAVVELARSLGLTVVAEGIETDEHWQLLQELGCGVGQGYRFSPPVEASAFARLAATPLGGAPD